jgi:hypothetical protein
MIVATLQRLLIVAVTAALLIAFDLQAWAAWVIVGGAIATALAPPPRRSRRWGFLSRRRRRR